MSGKPKDGLYFDHQPLKVLTDRIAALEAENEKYAGFILIWREKCEQAEVEAERLREQRREGWRHVAAIPVHRLTDDRGVVVEDAIPRVRVLDLLGEEGKDE